jgi:hypothetical protein
MFRKSKMIEKECALEIQDHALKAITELSLLLNRSQGRCSPERFEQLREGVGRAIGGIQMGILEVVISEFPELDDLK